MIGTVAELFGRSLSACFLTRMHVVLALFFHLIKLDLLVIIQELTNSGAGCDPYAAHIAALVFTGKGIASHGFLRLLLLFLQNCSDFCLLVSVQRELFGEIPDLLVDAERGLFPSALRLSQGRACVCSENTHHEYQGI